MSVVVDLEQLSCDAGALPVVGVAFVASLTAEQNTAGVWP